MRADVLSIWTVYDRPADHPEGFIARRFEIRDGGAFPTDDVRTSHLAHDLRESFILDGLTMLPRSEHDHPTVVESWL